MEAPGALDAMLAMGWTRTLEEGEDVLLLKKAATMAVVGPWTRCMPRPACRNIMLTSFPAARPYPQH